MNKFISIVLVVCALVAAVNCNGYGLGSNLYNVNSYSLGPSSLHYGSPYHSGYHGKASYSAQPLLAQEIYPGRNLYRRYNSAPTYSKIALPIVHSAPLAKLYGSSGYGGAAY